MWLILGPVLGTLQVLFIANTMIVGSYGIVIPEVVDPFFVVGLPRSGTAWISVALTCGPVSCLHETTRGCATFSEFAARLESQRKAAPIIGESSPSLPFYARQVAERWPGAKYVFIWRDPDEAALSYARAMRGFFTVEQIADTWPQIVHRRDAHRRALDQHLILDIQFSELFTAKSLKAIWSHVAPNHPEAFPLWRLCQLVDVRVKVDPHLAARQGPEAGAMPPLEPTEPDYFPLLSDEIGAPTHVEYGTFVRAICGESVPAWEWFIDVVAATKLLDHLTDGDPVHRGHGAAVIENMLVRWPKNQFWRMHQKSLSAALQKSILLWKRGNADNVVELQYEGYKLIPRAIAKALGRPCSESRLSKLIADVLLLEPRLHLQPA